MILSPLSDFSAAFALNPFSSLLCVASHCNVSNSAFSAKFPLLLSELCFLCFLIRALLSLCAKFFSCFGCGSQRCASEVICFSVFLCNLFGPAMPPCFRICRKLDCLDMELRDQHTPQVGEVRVRVKLTNGSEQMLAKAGALEQARVRTCEVDAMIDTGAVRSVITESVAKQLGLPTINFRTVAYADGRKESVPLAGPLMFDIDGRDTFDDAYILGDEVLIGQTVLEKMDLLVDFARQRLVPAHPEGPVNKLKTLAF
jgi:clan AA aspartic protease